MADPLSLPFEEAVRYFADKINVKTEHWTDVWQAAHARSFMVAGAATDALLDDFKRAILKALEDGTTLEEFRKDFDRIVETNGWAHNGTPGWRARIIYETNLSTAYSAGRYAQETDPVVLAVFPFWQYRHSGSRNPRHDHLSWHGLVLRADDPWWDTHYPPNGWRCGCSVEPMGPRDLARQGKDAPDVAPPLDLKPWRNPNTGEVTQVPKGIDPGFAWNPGKAWNTAPDGGPLTQAPAAPPVPPLGRAR